MAASWKRRLFSPFAAIRRASSPAIKPVRPHCFLICPVFLADDPYKPVALYPEIPCGSFHRDASSGFEIETMSSRCSIKHRSRKPSCLICAFDRHSVLKNRGSVWRTVSGYQHPAIANDPSRSGFFAGTTGDRATGELGTISMQFQHT